MKNKITSILIVCVMLITAFGVTAFAEASGTHGSNLAWTLSAEGVLTISGRGSMDNVYSNPLEDYKTDIKKVVISDGVTSVGDDSFQGFTNLTEVNLADSVTRIGAHAFYNCSALNTVTWSNKLEEIGGSAFSGTALESVDLPLSVKSVENYAFSSCWSLTELSLPSGIENVGIDIIDGTPFLNESCPDGSTEFYLGDILMMVDIFSETSYTIKSGTRIIAGGAFKSANKLADITIPDSVEYICDSAFSGRDNLKSVTIGSGVKKIGDNAFESSGLTSVNIPANVEVIGSNAFRYCEDLTTATLNEGLKSIERLAFSESALTEIIIPDSVLNVDHAVFSGCDSLKTMVIGDGVTYFDSGSFQCSALESLTIGNSLTGFTTTNSLSGATALKEIVIGDGFRNLDILDSLPNPELLESITVGSGVTEIEQQIFTNLTGLKTINLSDNVLVIKEEAFTNTAYYKDDANWEDGALYVDNCLVSVKSGKTSFEVKEGTVCIGDSAFAENMDTLKSVSLPNSLKSIGSYAFGYCNKLDNVLLPDGIINIGYYAFTRTAMYNDDTNWDNGKFYIGKYLLDTKNTASDFSIKEGTLCIAGRAFNEVKASLTEITMPDSVVSLSGEAFRDCKALEKVNFGSSIKYIGNEAFYNSVLVDVVLPDSIELLDRCAFQGCKKLKNIEIKSGIIGERAFLGCSALENVILGDRVTCIGENAFSGCTGLTKFTIPDSVTSLGKEPFAFCSGIKRITVGGGIKFLPDIVDDTSAVDLVLTKNTTLIECSILHNSGTLENIYYSGSAEDWRKILHSTHYGNDTVYPIIHFGVENPPDLSAVAVSGDGTTEPVSVSIALENHEVGGEVLVALIKDGIVIDVVKRPAAAVVDAAFKLGDTGTQVFVFWWESVNDVTPIAEMVSRDI